MITNNIPWTRYAYFVLLSLVAASGNMGIVFTINKIVNDFFTNTPILSSKYLQYFLYSLVFFITCRWLFSLGIIRYTQKQLHKTRLSVLKMILRSSYSNLVRNKNQVFTALTRDTDNVVNASINLVDIITNSILILICFTYMAILSWKLVLCMVGLMAFTLLIYFLSVQKAEKYFRLALEQNDRFVRYLNDILTGFKEISIEPRIGTQIADKHIDKAVGNLSVYNQKAHVTFLNNRIIGQMAFYIFIGVVLLFLGSLFGIEKGTLVNFVFLIMYIWGPIETVVLLIPVISQARTSVTRIASLEEKVNESIPVSTDSFQAVSFASVAARGISYEYPVDEELGRARGFNITDVDFHLEKGEAVFICGGNGSGKTTFLNIVVGLVKQDSGDILINGEKVKATLTNGYRSLFAPLFSDFYLFDELYAIQIVDYAKAAEYLRLFEVDEKVTVADGKFSDIHVSTGQRKRLALIGALLEKKPVLVLDEFAADQDPDFKKKFYKQIIPQLKREGFTLIAITHDDNYYQYADRLYKMDGGKMKEITLVEQTAVGLIA